jgi:hypothetical protein
MVACQKTKINASGDFSNAIEEDLLRIVKLELLKDKGRRELLIALFTTEMQAFLLGEGNARLTCCRVYAP